MKARFNIYEVEHYGDEQRALEDLHNAGCRSVLVIARDHEDGQIRVECDLPDNVTGPNQLHLEYCCL